MNFLYNKIYPLITILLLFLSLSCKDDKSPAEPDPSLDDRVDELLRQMTLDEKIGQMAQVEKDAVKNNKDDIKTYFIGSILSGGGSGPDVNTASAWADMYDDFQSYALKTKLKIPLIYGVDAVHGHNNVYGAVIFPHNIGMGCTLNPNLVEKAARVTAEEVAGTGIDWTFSPCIAVARNERWGRTYESFGETPELQKMMAEASVKGYQGTDLSDPASILACPKHFAGDGGTTNGSDQGNTQCDEQTLRNIHMQGYINAIKAGAGSIMVSYSSWNGQKMHGHKYLLTDVLKNELGFKGFLISDYNGIDQLPGDYKSDIEQAINAGIDMVMIPFNYKNFLILLKENINEGKIPMSRIDDAVRRILRIKFQMGLFERPYTNRSFTSKVGSVEHRETARECVRQSLVLLKNENNILPLSKNLSRLHIAGKSANDLGNQCGGWSLTWQGNSGYITEGTTIYEAVRNTVSTNTSITYSLDGSGAEGSDAAIVVVGETPYAEFMGDRSDLSLSQEDIQVINTLKNKGIPVVCILISGRPLIIEQSLNNCDSFIAAWLPGTEGQGVADVLFGDYSPSGKLGHSWPRTMNQIPINHGDSQYDPLFPLGYGLNY